MGKSKLSASDLKVVLFSFEILKVYVGPWYMSVVDCRDLESAKGKKKLLMYFCILWTFYDSWREFCLFFWELGEGDMLLLNLSLPFFFSSFSHTHLWSFFVFNKFSQKNLYKKLLEKASEKTSKSSNQTTPKTT